MMTEWFKGYAQQFDNIFEAAREELHSYISDTSKEVQGFRHRIDASSMTFAELQAEADYWTAQAEVAIRETRARQAMAVVDFEETVQKCIKLGAGDRATAIRWIRDQFAGEDDSYIRWELQLPYDFNLETGE
jgi:hypothetical protein